jgi:hypothetical protein
MVVNRPAALEGKVPVFEQKLPMLLYFGKRRVTPSDTLTATGWTLADPAANMFS